MTGRPASLLALRVPDFDAAVRVAVEPRLRGRPVVVASSFKPLGRVLAANPEARAEGVETDMPYPAARSLCPRAAFFVPDPRLADRAVRALLAKAAEFTPFVEPAGGGRVLLDTRGTERLWGAGLDVAQRLRRRTQEDLRLPVAAGLASRRPWSLLACRAAGAGGAWWVVPGQEGAFLDITPVAWVDGLDRRTRERLSEMKIGQIGQLRPFGPDELARQFGVRCARAFWAVLAPPDGDLPSVARWNPSGGADGRVGAAAILPEATASAERLRLAARALAGQAAADLRRTGRGAARLRLSLAYMDGATHAVQRKTGGYVQDEDLLIGLAEDLLAAALARRVAVSRLWLDAERLGPPARQGTLFSGGPAGSRPARPRAAPRLGAALDRIRERYGDLGIRPGASLASPDVYPDAVPSPKAAIA